MEELSFEEWEALGEKLGRIGKSIGFMIGDWINYAEEKWGEKYNEAIACTGLEYQTLRELRLCRTPGPIVCTCRQSRPSGTMLWWQS